MSLGGGSGVLGVSVRPVSFIVEPGAYDRYMGGYSLLLAPQLADLATVYVAGLDAALQVQLRERCRAKLTTAPFLLTAHAWAARGLA